LRHPIIIVIETGDIAAGSLCNAEIARRHLPGAARRQRDEAARRHFFGDNHTLAGPSSITIVS